jgi:hypothetical protein
MIGAIPISMLVSVLGYNLYRSVSNYLEDPTSFNIANVFGTETWENTERGVVFGIGISVSALIATADYIIGRTQRPDGKAGETD